MPLPILAAGALGARFLPGLLRAGRTLIGGRRGAAITGASIGGPAAFRAFSRRRGALAVGGVAAGSTALALRNRGGGANEFGVTVVGSWNTGTATFARLSDGRIATQKRNGVIKSWRPYRPVVIPKKWNSRSMSRVATAMRRQRKMAQEIVKLTGGTPRRRRK